MMTERTHNQTYDIVLFGVTGFTGKLVAEYLWQKYGDLTWAVCARNADKAQAVLEEIRTDSTNNNDDNNHHNSKRTLPPVLTADLLCTTEEQVAALRAIVEQTAVVLTCAGPFEKYGTTLVQLCAELGVYYADITGETDFVRQTIQKHDATARQTGAAILCHCGADCIPTGLTVYEMHRYAVAQGGTLQQVQTYAQMPESTSMSGGTVATAAFQLGKDRKQEEKPEFDPLLQTPEGTKSEYSTRNISPKQVVSVPELEGQKAGPWIMGPVMVNSVRRSNALLHYAKDFAYGDAMVKHPPTIRNWWKETSITVRMGSAILMPSVFSRFLPQPGQGPSRAVMEAGYLTIHGFGIMTLPTTGTVADEGSAATTPSPETAATTEPTETAADAPATESTESPPSASADAAPESPAAPEPQRIPIRAKFHFSKDVAYLYTAALLVETGLLLLAKRGTLPGGVMTPEVALGHALTERILQQLDAHLEISTVKTTTSTTTTTEVDATEPTISSS